MIKHCIMAPTNRDLRYAFELFDSDDKGKITLANLIRLVKVRARKMPKYYVLHSIHLTCHRANSVCMMNAALSSTDRNSVQFYHVNNLLLVYVVVPPPPAALLAPPTLHQLERLRAASEEDFGSRI